MTSLPWFTRMCVVAAVWGVWWAIHKRREGRATNWLQLRPRFGFSRGRLRLWCLYHLARRRYNALVGPEIQRIQNQCIDMMVCNIVRGPSPAGTPNLRHNDCVRNGRIGT